MLVERAYLDAQESFVGARQIRFRNISDFENREWIAI